MPVRLLYRVVAPDLAAKVDIVQNAIDFAHALGFGAQSGDVRVAILSANENVNPKIVSTLEADEPLLFAANVLGTRNLLLAAREAGCGRVVVTGSFSAVGHREDGQACDESLPFNPFGRIMPYEKSKAGVEHEVLKACVEGQDVVIATSCAIIGAHDYGPSRMGRTIRDYANGQLRA